jgi:superfamily II DNA or RNA helicase
MEIQWRPYQIDCFTNIYSDYKNNGIKELMVVEATGLGKRLQAVHISTKFKTSLFLAHNTELIEQAYDEFCNFHPKENVGIVKAERNEIDKPIVIASPQTLYNRLDSIPKDKFQLVQADECHKYLAKTYCACVRHFDHELRLGWTATPKRLDGLPMSHLFEKISFEYGIDKGIADKFLCELNGIRVKTEVELKNIGKSMGDFNIGELSSRVDIPERNQLLVDKYNEFAKGRQFVVFACTKVHAYHIQQKFKDAGINTEVLVSGDLTKTERKQITNKFKSGKLQGIINIDILTEGFDYNDVSCIIMARPTESLAKYVQAIGRGTRLKSPKVVAKHGNNCVILDIVDNSGKHSLINTYTLDKGKDIDDRIFVTKEKKEEFKEALREKQERLSKITGIGVKQDEAVNLVALPDITISKSPKMDEKATPAQIRFLIDLGVYDESCDYTKRLASEVISNMECNSFQLRKLHQWGYDISEGAKLQQYQKAKTKIENKTKFIIPEEEKRKVKYQ